MALNTVIINGNTLFSYRRAAETQANIINFRLVQRNHTADIEIMLTFY